MNEYWTPSEILGFPVIDPVYPFYCVGITATTGQRCEFRINQIDRVTAHSLERELARINIYADDFAGSSRHQDLRRLLTELASHILCMKYHRKPNQPQLRETVTSWETYIETKRVEWQMSRMRIREAPVSVPALPRTVDQRVVQREAVAPTNSPAPPRQAPLIPGLARREALLPPGSPGSAPPVPDGNVDYRPERIANIFTLLDSSVPDSPVESRPRRNANPFASLDSPVPDSPFEFQPRRTANTPQSHEQQPSRPSRSSMFVFGSEPPEFSLRASPAIPRPGPQAPSRGALWSFFGQEARPSPLQASLSIPRQAPRETHLRNRKTVVRKPFDDDICGICREAFDDSKESIWCRGQCGANIHTECFNQWRMNCLIYGQPLTCIHWYAFHVELERHARIDY